MDFNTNPLNENEVKRMLTVLKKAGLCICSKYLIDDHHPGLEDDDRVLLAIEEHGGFGDE